MTDVGYSGIVSPAQARAVTGPNTIDLKRSLRNFQETLKGYLLDYADPTKGMVISGRYFSAEQKTGPAATLLMQADVTNMQESINTLVNIWSSLYQLEKGIGGSSS